MTKKQREAQEAQEASAAHLREVLPRHGTVYTTLRRVSDDGMSRVIAFHIIIDVQITGTDGRQYTEPGIMDITEYVSNVLGYSIVRTPLGAGVRVRGAEADMGYLCVYYLALHLYDSGYDLHHRWL